MSILEIVRSYVDGNAAAAIILVATAKATLLLGLALLINAALRSASASTRHLVWSAAIGAVLLIPALAILVPAMTVPLPAALASVAPVEVSAGAAAQPALADAVDEPASAIGVAKAEPTTITVEAAAGNGVGRSAATGRAETVDAPAMVGSGRRTMEPGWTTWLVAVWMTGALVAVATILMGLARTWLAGRRATRIDSGPLVRELEELAAEIGVRRRVGLLLCSGSCMPMTWGLFYPVILLPRNATNWSDERLRSVLLHELAHVKRLDVLTQLVARLTCALHWFNPMAWLAARRLRVERELACDDQVLLAGSRASEYATHLLDIARSLRGEPFTAASTVAMARPSQLGDRLRAVLDAGRARRALTRRATLAVWTVALLVALPLAAAVPGKAARQDRPAIDRPHDSVARSTVVAAQGRADALDWEQTTPARAESFPATPGDLEIAWAANEASPSVRHESPARLVASAMLCDWYVSGNTSTSINADDDEWRVKIERGNCKLEMKLEGKLVFNDGETEIVAIRGGGRAEIEEKRGGDSRKLLLTANGSGSLERRWWVNGRERDYDDEARAWQGDMILVLFRRAGYQATERAERILARGGTGALLQEIEQIPGDYAAGRYYTVLLAKGDLSSEELAQALRQAGRDVESDHMLGQLLAAVAENRTMDATVTAAYMEAARSLESDFQKGQVLRALVERGRLNDDVVRAVLETAATIDSDFELARVLRALSDEYTVDGAIAMDYLAAASNINSSFELRRTLKGLAEGGNLDPAAVKQLLETSLEIDSGHELGTLLQEVNRVYGIDDVTRSTFFRVCATIDSDFQLGSVLKDVVRDGDADEATLREVLGTARGLNSDHELGTLLVQIADSYTIDGDLRDDFMRAADSLNSDYQRNRVLAALNPRGSGTRR